MAKLYRKMRPGIRLLAKLEPIAESLNETCYNCGGPVVLWFAQKAPRKHWYPDHESCTWCGGSKRTFEQIKQSQVPTPDRIES